MSGSERLKAISAELDSGGTPGAVTVRTLLGWFGAERRGYYIVASIRRALKAAMLKTDPDFEAVYIDAAIQFRRADVVPPTQEAAISDEAPVPPVTDSSQAIPIVLHPAYVDPTYRISKLSAANTAVVSVHPDATLREAVTLMLGHDFSQLPVMTSEREVKGIVSWQSIASRLALGRQDGSVREFMESAQEIETSASLFTAIPTIVQSQYVLVRAFDRRVVGIVTASDLSLQFQQLSEPFLLLAEIENHIRRVLAGRLSTVDLFAGRVQRESQGAVESVADLSFGDYVSVLERQDLWDKAGLPVDRVAFVKQLTRVRDIRNDVMHFDPDGIPPSDLEALRDFTRFLQRLQTIGVA